MNIPYITNGQNWTFFVKGKPILITLGDIRLPKIIDCISNNDEATLISLLEASDLTVNALNSLTQTTSFEDLTFKVDNDTKEITVTYKTLKLPDVLTDKLVNLWVSNCTDFTHYFKFIDNLMLNHSERARNELYKFLTVCNLPITQDGTFIAYKGIASDGYSCNGNLNTRVLSGIVDSTGRIRNSIGDVIKVATEDVSTDKYNPCAEGLHVGSYEYANSFGKVTIAVEVNPKDVVSVPVDYNFQKCRVSAYKVLNTICDKYLVPDVDIIKEESKVVEVTHENTVNKLEEMTSASNIFRTRRLIDKNIDSHCVTLDGSVFDKKKNDKTDSWHKEKTTTLQQLVGSVGRKYNISLAGMLAVLTKLGYTVILNERSLGKSWVKR